MSEPNIRKGDRFRWWISDRSGLQFGFQPLTSYPNSYTRESGRPVRDHGFRVAPDEFDQPPPSTKPLGGEGEIGTGARENSNPATPANAYIYPPGSLIPVQYLTAASKIAWNQNNLPVYVAGSNQAVTLAGFPLALGPAQLYISIQCVGSSVTLNAGSGISIDFNRSSVTLNSGGIITLISNATDSTWHITSFNPNGGL